MEIVEPWELVVMHTHDEKEPIKDPVKPTTWMKIQIRLWQLLDCLC